jgi:hypothetical protein
MPPISLDVFLICLNYARYGNKTSSNENPLWVEVLQNLSCGGSEDDPNSPPKRLLRRRYLPNWFPIFMYCKFTKKEFRYGQKKTHPALYLSKNKFWLFSPYHLLFLFRLSHRPRGAETGHISLLFAGTLEVYATQLIDVSCQFSKFFLFTSFSICVLFC